MIRFARKEDMSSVLSLIQELADFEKEPDAVIITEEDLLKDGFGVDPKFHCLVAEKARNNCWNGIVLSPLFYLERGYAASRRSYCYPKFKRRRIWKRFIHCLYNFCGREAGKKN